MKYFIIAVTVLLSACVNLDQRKWEEFSVANNCKLVSYTAPSSSTGAHFAFTGQGSVMIPSVQHYPARSEYLCNGIKFVR